MPQPFHTDLCDVLSMYALNTAAYGGESFLASSAKIYNELARTRPDIIEVLAKDDWIFDECVCLLPDPFTHHTPTLDSSMPLTNTTRFWQGQYHTRPLLYNFASHGPAFQFSRRPLTGAHFSPHRKSVQSELFLLLPMWRRAERNYVPAAGNTRLTWSTKP